MRYPTRMLLAALFACATPDSGAPIADEGGLTPFDDNGIEAPVDDDDATPERAAMISGSDDEFDWAALRGWVKADAPTVWELLQNPDVGVNRRDVVEWTVAEVDEDKVDNAYVVTETVDEPIIVTFDVTWLHDQADDPADGSISVWQKTAGTQFIETLAGSVVATGHDGVVDFLVVFHLATIDSGPEKCEEFVTDFYASVLAVAHGEPLPTYE